MNTKINAAQRLTAAEDHVEAIKQLVTGYFGPKHVAGVEATHGTVVTVYLKMGVTVNDLQWLLRECGAHTAGGVEVRPSQHSGTVAILVDAAHYQAPKHNTGREDHP
jgi:hypothetical protein